MFQCGFVPRYEVACFFTIYVSPSYRIIGNEDDHIIISLVRSDRLGFLNNERRSVVMLSRCRRSMVICTSREFLRRKASMSILGCLAVDCGDRAWLAAHDILQNKWD